MTQRIYQCMLAWKNCAPAALKLPKLSRLDKQQDKRLNALIAEQLGEQARGTKR